MEKKLFGRILPLATFCLGMFTMSFINNKEVIIVKESVKHIHETVNVDTPSVEVSGITGTYYNAVPEQCDGSPLVTADGSKIDLTKLKNWDIRWVALSRNLLSRWGGPFDYGDTIYVQHKNSKIKGYWVVHDTMNKRAVNKIDFLVSLDNEFPGKTHDIILSKL